MYRSHLIALLCSTVLLNNALAKNIGSVKTQSLYFIENKGQVRDQNGNYRADIQYILQANGITIFIGAGNIHYQFAKFEDCDSYDPSKLESYRMDVELVGANKNATIVAGEK